VISVCSEITAIIIIHKTQSKVEAKRYITNHHIWKIQNKAYLHKKLQKRFRYTNNVFAAFYIFCPYMNAFSCFSIKLNDIQRYVIKSQIILIIWR
jgi:hypothetical protein